jgi:hypothetical protein
MGVKSSDPESPLAWHPALALNFALGPYSGDSARETTTSG